MTTLLSLVKNIAGDEDLVGELCRYLWEAELPDDLCDPIRSLIARGIETIRQRHRRHRARLRTNVDDYLERHGGCVADPSKQVEARELLQLAVSSDFDAAALEAELDGRFAEFAQRNPHCSCAAAYKRRAAYHERVRRLAREAEKHRRK
jgi:predicted TIM-barrel fold metal-dependent hydrolase